MLIYTNIILILKTRLTLKQKSFFYSTGLVEGAETIAVFVAMCLFPHWFGVIAYGYAALCVLTVLQRSAMAVTQFR